MLFSVKRNNYFKNPKNNAVFTPKRIVNMMIQLLESNCPSFKPEIILESNFGDGGIIIPLLEYFSDFKKAIGIEIQKEYYDKVQNIYKNDKRVKLIEGDFLQMDMKEYKNEIDLIFSNPPFSIEYENKLIKGSWLYFMNICFELLNDNGKMVFILPNYWCLNTNKNIIRYIEYLPSFNFVPLPKNVFYKNSIPCQLVIFDKKNEDKTLYSMYKMLYGEEVDKILKKYEQENNLKIC